MTQHTSYTAQSARRAAKPVGERNRNAAKSTSRSKRNATAAKRAAIYARYSVAHDGKLSHTKQISEGKAKAAAKGFDVDPSHIFVDEGKSAGEGKHRPEWERLRDAIRSGKIDVLIVSKLDRFTRSTKDFAEVWAELQEYGVELISIAEDFDTTSAMGRAMQQIVVTFAELERAFAVDRNRGIAKFRRDEGHVGGLAPYGYTKVGKGADARFEIDETQAAVVRDICARIIDGESLRSIARTLNEAGTPLSQHARRSDWIYTTVRQTVCAPAVAGWREDPATPDEYLRAPWEPIIDDETWRIMLHALQSSTRRTHSLTTGRTGETPVANLLSGLLLCGRCGTKMGPMRQPNGKLRYRCTKASNPNACLGPSVLAADAEQHVIAELFKALRAGGRKLAPTPMRDDDRAAEIQAELDELEALYVQRRIKLDELMRWRDAAASELQSIDRAAERERRDSAIVKLLADGGDVQTVWESGKLTIDVKRAILREAFPLIVCRDNGGKGVRVPIDERIAISDQSEIEAQS